jgi:hypothetical protein
MKRWLTAGLLMAAALSAQARFIGEDPAGFEDGLNPYSYTQGDPIDFVDPDGRSRQRPFISRSPILEQYYVPLRNPPRPATTPVWRGAGEMLTPGAPSQNPPGQVCGRSFSGHAFDRMQGRGLTPSVVLDAIQNGQRFPGNSARESIFYSPNNNVSVIVNTANGRVVTVRQGPPNGQP